MRLRPWLRLKASEVSLNNLAVGFVPLAIRPSIHSPLYFASGDAAAIPLPLRECYSEQRQVTECVRRSEADSTMITRPQKRRRGEGAPGEDQEHQARLCSCSKALLHPDSRMFCHYAD